MSDDAKRQPAATEADAAAEAASDDGPKLPPSAAVLLADGLVRLAEPRDHGVDGFHASCIADAVALPGIARVLQEEGCFLEMMTCLDRRQTDDGMLLVYTFNRFDRAERLRVEAPLAATREWTGPPPPKLKGAAAKKQAEAEAAAKAAAEAAAAAGEEPPPPPPERAPSVADVFPAADWYEREVYDMYGVEFDDHPDLKRILLPDDADFHALLKDFGRIEDAETTLDDQRPG